VTTIAGSTGKQCQVVLGSVQPGQIAQGRVCFIGQPPSTDDRYIDRLTNKPDAGLTRIDDHMDASCSEQQHAEVTLDSIGDAVISVDIRGNVRYLNLAAERMTGWSRQEAVGRPLDEICQIINGETRERARNPMEVAVQLDATVGLPPNCSLIRRDGFEMAIDDSASPVHDRQGHLIGSYLRQFPIDALKVDQSFVHEISADPAGTPIVCAVISMGRSLGHRVIAEGVETREQLAFLQAQRCGEGQGYYFSPPLVAEKFVRVLETGLGELVLQ
jgi:PAS domain S-box-containing protein